MWWRWRVCAILLAGTPDHFKVIMQAFFVDEVYFAIVDGETRGVAMDRKHVDMAAQIQHDIFRILFKALLRNAQNISKHYALAYSRDM